MQPVDSTFHVAVVDCGSSKVGELVSLLAALGARPRRVPLENPGVALEADALVLSGGPRLFTAEPALVDAFAFLDAVTVPTLGICLGHQAIALRAGARVFLGPERRGLESIALTRAHPLVTGVDSPSAFVADHCEGITLPAGFECLGASAHYQVEIMAGVARPLFGVQFHPEVSGDLGRRLLANFLRLASAADHR